MSKPILTCFGGVGSVTGANFLLEIHLDSGGVGTQKILIDCGLLQGVQASDAVNAGDFDYDVSAVDYLFITHAHIDHIGRIPKLVKDGFKGVIYSTPETRAIAELMLLDTAKINEGNARTRGGEPIYTAADSERSMTLWKSIEYHESKDFGLSEDGFSVELFDAGHILGSAMYKFTFKSGKSMLFTGDLGNSPSPLLRDAEQISGLDYILMDSVYGDRNHEDKTERDAKFKTILRRVIENKSTLLIPTFSLERTQILLYELDNLFESRELPAVPVFLDSPLAIRVTDIYEKITKEYKPSVQAEIKSGDDIFKFPRLRMTAQVRDSHQIREVEGPKIILAGSGMSTAGRILNHEETYLPDKDATLLFVGYQAPGTMGRTIEEGAKSVVINGHEVKVRAHIEKIDGYSAHADSNALVDFVSHSATTLKKVFVTMGEPRSSIFLAQRLRDEQSVDAIVPERGQKYELDL